MSSGLIRAWRCGSRWRHDGVGFIFVVLVATVVAVVVGAAGSSRSDASRRLEARAQQQRSGSGLLGADTTLLMWPAGPPIFGDLPGGGPGTTVIVDDLSTGRVSLRRIPSIAGGDFPYSIVPVGPWLVYNGDAGASVIGDDLVGSPRVLGRASFFVPSARKGSVWLVDQNQSGSVVSVRSASVATGSIGPSIALPKSTAVVEGTDRGLLLLTQDGKPGNWALELWRPGGRATRLAYLPEGGSDVAAADARVVAYASACRWETATSGFPKTPVGFVVCATLRVIDLLDGVRYRFAAPRGTLGWVPNEFGLDSAIAPSNIMLAAQAAIPPASTGRARQFVLCLRGGPTSPIKVPDSTAPLYSRAAWSTNGSWLLYQGPGERLRAFRPGGTSLPLGTRCCEYASAVSIRSSQIGSFGSGGGRSGRSGAFVAQNGKDLIQGSTLRLPGGRATTTFAITAPADHAYDVTVTAPAASAIVVTMKIPTLANDRVINPAAGWTVNTLSDSSCHTKAGHTGCLLHFAAGGNPGGRWTGVVHKTSIPAARIHISIVFARPAGDFPGSAR